MKRLSTMLGIVVLVLSMGLTLMSGVPAAAAANWYVDPIGTDDVTHGTGPGTAAFKTIQYGINRAGNGDTINMA